jgi:DNA-binding NarL/FixJ family response regulator
MASILKERGAKGFIKLSERETQVCDSILRGMTTYGIAKNLAVAETSVTTFRKRAYAKLRIHSKSQLFALAMNYHL